jgi:hypothetical protein
MAVVKIFTGYYWDCPCGARNFEEGVPAELTQEDRAEIEEREGIDLSELGNGDLVSYPDEVTCNKCGAEHEVVDPREGENYDYNQDGGDD